MEIDGIGTLIETTSIGELTKVRLTQFEIIINNKKNVHFARVYLH